MNLPANIAEACRELFEQLPIENAMSELLDTHPSHSDLVEKALSYPAMANRDDLAAGLWLYVNDLYRSHTISQGILDRTGSYWHGIMHRREGDFSNSHYWFRRAAGHPLMEQRPDLDPDMFVDQVAAARGVNAPELVAKQREEWQALFEYCAGAVIPGRN